MIYRILHDIFFVSPILSPFILGKTLYADLLFLIVDFRYWRWNILNLKKALKSNRGKFLLILIILTLSNLLVGSLIHGRISSNIRFIFIWLEILYVAYGFSTRSSYLWLGMLINYIVIIIQFIQLSLGFGNDSLFSPVNISTAIYGDYAKPVFLDIQESYLLNFRVSGLSTEAGFASSLIMSIEFIRIKFGNDFFFPQKNLLIRIFGRKRLIRIYITLTYISYLLTFSKVSPLLILYILFKKIKLVVIDKKINLKFPTALLVIFLFVFSPTLILANNPIWRMVPPKTSYYDRLASFRIVSELKPSNLLFGASNEYLTNSKVYKGLTVYRDEEAGESLGFAGIATLIIFHGITTFILFAILCQYFTPDWITQLFFLLGISNVTPITTSSFVICYYIFLLFQFSEQFYLMDYKQKNRNSSPLNLVH